MVLAVGLEGLLLCLIPPELPRYFCLLDVSDDFVRSLPGALFLDREGDGGARWCPALRVLPMGWSWSFYFAQIAHATEVQRALQLPAGCLLLDCRPPPKLAGETVLVLPYCDNLTVAATPSRSHAQGR